jgi:conjugal transfer pilin signal peptidase TrbI
MLNKFSDAINDGSWLLINGWHKLARNRIFNIALNVAFGLMLVLLLGVVAAWAVKDKYSINVNLTESLPNKVFIIAHGTPVSRGDYVAYRYHSGPPYPDGAQFVKIVEGVGGDVVTVDDRMVSVNGLYAGYAKPLARSGLPLAPIKAQTLPANTYYVRGTHRDSLDSRYAHVGPIPGADLIGRAIPLF